MAIRLSDMIDTSTLYLYTFYKRYCKPPPNNNMLLNHF